MQNCEGHRAMEVREIAFVPWKEVTVYEKFCLTVKRSLLLKPKTYILESMQNP